MDLTLIKGLRVLELLAESDEPRRISDLAAECRLQKSNVHRVLQTLIKCGYIRQDADTGRYRCTLKMWSMGGRIADKLDLRGIARPHLRRLSEQTSETVHLSILEGHEVLYLEKIESPLPVAAYSRLGGGGPVHCSATGKCLLAFAEPETIRSLPRPLKAFTARTIVTLGKLQRELQTIRNNGFAVTREEWHEAICGVAAPVFGGEGNAKIAIAAIGVSGLSARVTPARQRAFAPMVQAAANAISRDLG